MADFDFDVFISHSSEDKAQFVRPLVAALEEQNLSVWYDETELKPGSRLIQTIEKGLSRSRFGVVVISPSFFSRGWPRAELDALTNREFATGESVLLPVWLDVDAETVASHSPLLVDRVAIRADRGIEYTCSRIVETVRPGHSPLVLAREELNRYGVATPPPSDSWWLEQIASAAVAPGEQGFQSAMVWDRWGFPLPIWSDDPHDMTRRLSQAVLSNNWVAEAERLPITQITPPDQVLSFIEEMPGLYETCLEHPSYLGAYAPQLLFRGFGGPFEDLFDEWLDYATRSGHPSETASLHSEDLTSLDPAEVTCAFVQGELHGPSVDFYNHIDYFFWLLSEQSHWLPPVAREVMIRGFVEWPVWLTPAPTLGDSKADLALLNEVLDARKEKRDFVMTEERFSCLKRAAAESATKLGLPEPAALLAERLADTGALQQYH